MSGFSAGGGIVGGAGVTVSYSTASGESLVGIGFGVDASFNLSIIPESISEILQQKKDD